MIKWLLENVSAELPEYVEAQALARSKRLDGGWAELTVDPHKALGFLSRDGACTAVGFMRYKPGVTIAVVEHDFVDADYPPLVVVAEDRGDNFYNWRLDVDGDVLVRGSTGYFGPDEALTTGREIAERIADALAVGLKTRAEDRFEHIRRARR